MPIDIQHFQTVADQILQMLQTPFWKHLDFWTATLIGVAGLVFSILAFLEARKAKTAATAAGRTVKLQTVIIELMEVSQGLFEIKQDILFVEARHSLSVISSKVRRAATPFAADPKLSAAIKSTIESIDAAEQSLQAVCPSDPAKEQEAPYATYNAIQAHFFTISDNVYALIGLFEKETLDFGESKHG